MDTPMGEQSPQPVSPAPAPVAPATSAMPEEKKGSWVKTLVWIVVLAAIVYGVIWYFWLK